MICGYCNNRIVEEEYIPCKWCNTFYHKKCWEENQGCSMPQCIYNPKVRVVAENVGNKTLKEIEDEMKAETTEKIQESDLSLTDNNPGINTFDDEFRKRYDEKTSFRKRRNLIITGSLILLLIILILSAITIYKKIYQYYNTEDYKINALINKWENSIDTKDINKYIETLDKDYQYIEKNKKPIDIDERIRRMTKTFESYTNIDLKIIDKNIQIDSALANYCNVSFLQKFEYDKKNDISRKTLRLYKGEETDGKWKIFREYAE